MENRDLIVHALVDERPLCGFSDDELENWPPEHSWTEATDLENINCPGCREKAKTPLPIIADLE